MKSTLITAAVLYAIYKFAPNAAIKTMALGAAGGVALAYVPFANGKNLKGEAI